MSSLPAAGLHSGHTPRRGALFALLTIAAILIARLIYLKWFCPYTLIEDEAHYWEWSRRLDLSYYTKGPGIAWTIAAGTKLVGDSEFGVRFFAPIASAITASTLAILAWRMSGRWAVAAATVLAFLCVPIFHALGLQMTIDGPFAACWSLTALFVWLGFGEHNATKPTSTTRLFTFAVLAGLTIGVGCLYKYTILLIVPGLLGWAWCWRRSLPRKSVAACLLATMAGFAAALPIILWNTREGWPTIRHLLGHLGVKGGDMPVTVADHTLLDRFQWLGEFAGTQLGMIGPILLIGVFAAARAIRNRDLSGDSVSRAVGHPRWRAQSLLVACSAPILLFYLGVSLIAEPEGNWALAGSLTLIPLAAWSVTERVHDQSSSSADKGLRALWFLAAAFGICTAAGLLRLDLLAKLPVVGPLVPIGRVTGADLMGRDASHRLQLLANQTGTPPFIIGQHYGRVSQLAFYVDGQPTVYCSSPFSGGGRTTQYDYFSDTNLHSASVNASLEGRPALALGAELETWASVFETAVPAGYLNGDLKRKRPVFLCTGFKGMPTGPNARITPDMTAQAIQRLTSQGLWPLSADDKRQNRDPRKPIQSPIPNSSLSPSKGGTP